MLPDANIDVSKLTPAAAGQFLIERAGEIQDTRRCDFATAFEAAKLRFPDFTAKMASGNQGIGTRHEIKVILGNDGIPAAPAFTPTLKNALGLPPDADEEECQTAWKATKGVTTPRDTGAIIQALGELIRTRLIASGKAELHPAMFNGQWMRELNQRFPGLVSASK